MIIFSWISVGQGIPIAKKRGMERNPFLDFATEAKAASNNGNDVNYCNQSQESSAVFAKILHSFLNYAKIRAR